MMLLDQCRLWSKSRCRTEQETDQDPLLLRRALSAGQKAWPADSTPTVLAVAIPANRSVTMAHWSGKTPIAYVKLSHPCYRNLKFSSLLSSPSRDVGEDGQCSEALYAVLSFCRFRTDPPGISESSHDTPPLTTTADPSSPTTVVLSLGPSVAAVAVVVVAPTKIT